MRSIGSASPVLAYMIGPHAPDAVTEAKAAFDAVAAKYEECRADVKAAKQAVSDARAADIRAAADAYAAGKEPGDTQAQERAAAEKVEALEARLRALNVAADETGNALAHGIAAARKEWLPVLRKAEADAAKRFDKATAEALKALEELRPARGAIGWLEEFDAGKAEGGRVPGFAGGQLRVQGKIPGQLQGQFDPSDLLRIVAQATAKPEAPRPSRNRLTEAEVAEARSKRTLVGHP